MCHVNRCRYNLCPPYTGIDTPHHWDIIIVTYSRNRFLRRILLYGLNTFFINILRPIFKGPSIVVIIDFLCTHSFRKSAIRTIVTDCADEYYKLWRFRATVVSITNDIIIYYHKTRFFPLCAGHGFAHHKKISEAFPNGAGSAALGVERCVHQPVFV